MSENTIAYIQMFAPLILIFAALWFFMIRPQKKRDNETKQMRNSLQEGDEIVTIGGIVGKVLNVKEEAEEAESKKRIKKLTRKDEADKNPLEEDN